MRKGWHLVSLLSKSTAHQHGDLNAVLPLAARCLATAAGNLSAGCLPAICGPAQPVYDDPGFLSGKWQSPAAPSCRGFAAAASEGSGGTPGPSPAKLRAVPFTVTRQDAVREFEEYHSSNWLFKQPANGAQLPLALPDTATMTWTLAFPGEQR